jgi:hypothetical protein
MRVDSKFDPVSCTETTTLHLENAEDVRLNKEHFYACLDNIADVLDDDDPSAAVVHCIVLTVIKKNHAIN